MLVDSHCHLMKFLHRGELSEIMDEAREMGVERMITIGTDIEDWEPYLELARAHPNEKNILWTPIKNDDVLRRRITEHIEHRDGAVWFISEGFERILSDEEKPRTLLFKVELKKVS